MMWPSATLSKSDPSTIPTEEVIILSNEYVFHLDTRSLQLEAKKPKKPVSAFSFPPNSAAWAAARTLCDAVVEPRRTREVGVQTRAQN